MFDKKLSEKYDLNHKEVLTIFLSSSQIFFF